MAVCTLRGVRSSSERAHSRVHVSMGRAGLVPESTVFCSEPLCQAQVVRVAPAGLAEAGMSAAACAAVVMASADRDFN